MSVLRRLAGVLRGDGATFAVLARDRAATAQALGVTAVASAIGQFTIDADAGAFALGAVSGSIGLFAWSMLLWANARMMGGMAAYLAVVRGIGYAAAPFVLIGVPVIGVAAVVYSVSLQVAATKHITGISTGRSMAAVVVPWVLLVIVVALSLQPGT